MPAGRSFGLLPDRRAEIDLILIGEHAGSGADGAADQCALKRSPDQSSADGAGRGADPAAAEGAIRRAASACSQDEERNGQGG